MARKQQRATGHTSSNVSTREHTPRITEKRGMGVFGAAACWSSLASEGGRKSGLYVLDNERGNLKEGKKGESRGTDSRAIPEGRRERQNRVSSNLFFITPSSVKTTDEKKGGKKHLLSASITWRRKGRKTEGFYANLLR